MMIQDSSIHLIILSAIDLGAPVGQLRAVPVDLGAGAPRAFLAIYCADFDDDPYEEMFFFPTDTLKLALIDELGQILWKRDLGKGVVPGVWFCPVFPFDLDEDGVEEIWLVNNTNPSHPLSLQGYCLEKVDARTGKTLLQIPWMYHGSRETLSFTYRNFILGGSVRGKPVLVTAQGTYADMYLQGWNGDMSRRWEHHIPRTSPGARGSHMCAIADMDGDGVDEVLWGERCIELDQGKKLFCAAQETYRGHSDIALPILDRKSGKWSLYTCRESDPAAAPRVVCFDQRGKFMWGDVDSGHMDMGWAAHFSPDDSPVAMAIRIGRKTCGIDGRFHFDCDEFTWNCRTGTRISLPFRVYGTLPVDLNGDGMHELVRGIAGQAGEVLGAQGEIIGQTGGSVALISKFVSRPGEQILVSYPEGVLRIWGDANAEDRPEALARYQHPYYRANQRLSAVGYNLVNLGGL